MKKKKHTWYHVAPTSWCTSNAPPPPSGTIRLSHLESFLAMVLPDFMPMSVLDVIEAFLPLNMPHQIDEEVAEEDGVHIGSSTQDHQHMWSSKTKWKRSLIAMAEDDKPLQDHKCRKDEIPVSEEEWASFLNYSFA